MLQHEQAPQTSPFNYAPPNPAPITPQELAQAIIAVEERQGSDTRTTIDPAVIRQTLEQGRVDVTPEQLLKEVQMQRSIAHQDTAMTGRSRELPSWLLLSGATAAAAAIVFLLVTNYLFALSLRYSNQNVVRLQDQLNISSAETAASPLLQHWLYPHANTHVPSGSTSHLATINMTTTDSYAAVWKYYAQQIGYASVARDMRLYLASIPLGVTTSGTFSENGQVIYYDLVSNPTPTGLVATFTRRTPQYTLTGILTSDAARDKIIINLVVTTK